MSTTQGVLLALLLIVLVVGVAGAWAVLRRRSRQQDSASEYDRVIAESETRLAGEQALRERQRQHSSLEPRELSPQARAQYASTWRQRQLQFADSPQQAVSEADDLVTRLLEDLGYPIAESAQRLEQLSDKHEAMLRSYREAHEISMSNRRGETTTEQLRLALAHFQALVADLLSEEPAPAP